MPEFGPPWQRDIVHGTVVAACAASTDCGIAPGAKVILVEIGSGESERWNKCFEKYLAGFISVLDDVVKKGRQGKAVINLSASIYAPLVTPQFTLTMGESIHLLFVSGILCHSFTTLLHRPEAQVFMPTKAMDESIADPSFHVAQLTRVDSIYISAIR